MAARRILGYPGFGYRNPFAELERMRRDMDELAGLFFNKPGPAGVRAGVFPSVNLTEDANSFFIRAELPGVEAGDLDIQTSGNSITISGERKIAAKEGVKYHRREREAGKFSRAVNLPKPIDREKIEASLVNGLLTVEIPKAEEAKPRQISVK